MAIDVETLLRQGEIEVVGRLVQASNATLFVRIHGQVSIDAVYKPVIGEEPLWDFPDGTLGKREVAAYLVSELLGFHLVPTTIFRDGPYGPGMLQEWIDIDPGADLIDLVQSDDIRLARMALFDALVNNTDRKVGHLLPTQDGRLLGCDHGVTFHVDDKLRTVIWQFRGQPIEPEWMQALEPLRVRRVLDSLQSWLSAEEIAAFDRRCSRILESGVFPEPSPAWPAVPWPPI